MIFSSVTYRIQHTVCDVLCNASFLISFHLCTMWNIPCWFWLFSCTDSPMITWIFWYTFTSQTHLWKEIILTKFCSTCVYVPSVSLSSSLLTDFPLLKCLNPFHTAHWPLKLMNLDVLSIQCVTAVSSKGGKRKENNTIGIIRTYPVFLRRPSIGHTLVRGWAWVCGTMSLAQDGESWVLHSFHFPSTFQSFFISGHAIIV